MDVTAFDYDLPAELICAVHRWPSGTLRACSSFPVRREHPSTDRYAICPALLGAGDLLVVNDAKVIPARLHGHKEGTGGKVELLLVEPLGGRDWLASGWGPRNRCGRAPSSKRTARGSRWSRRERASSPSGSPWKATTCGDTSTGRGNAVAALHRTVPRKTAIGAVPDNLRARAWSGRGAHRRLHFTDALRRFAARARDRHRPDHAPCRARHLPSRAQPANRGATACIASGTRCRARRRKHGSRTREQGGRVIAVGTTALRTLEGGERRWEAPRRPRRDRSLRLSPGYSFRAVDGLFNKLHNCRESTLLMLVAAFAGLESNPRRLPGGGAGAISLLQLRRRDVDRIEQECSPSRTSTGRRGAANSRFPTAPSTRRSSCLSAPPAR